MIVGDLCIKVSSAQNVQDITINYNKLQNNAVYAKHNTVQNVKEN